MRQALRQKFKAKLIKILHAAEEWDGCLNDFVYDLKSTEAEEINRGGWDSQIDYLLDNYGPETLKKEIEDTFGIEVPDGDV